MKNLKIGARLGVGFGMILLLMMVLIAVSFIHLTNIDESASALVKKEWVKANAANNINLLTRANARNSMELLIVTEQARLDEIRKRIDANRKIITEELETLGKLIDLPAGQALLEKIKEERARYAASFMKVAQLVAEGKRDEAIKEMESQTLGLLDKLQESVKELAQHQETLVAERGDNITQGIDSTRSLLVIMGLSAVVVGIGFSWWIARSITSPMSEAVNVAQRVAAGDLTSHIEVRSKDETGQLLQALKDMNGALVNIVSEVRNGTETIASASQQIASGNADLSSRTEEQASSLEETASSMEELTSTVKQNADNARQANQLAVSASEVAVKGGAVVSEVVDTMGSINESARKIVDIIGVIDGIAFQTNILALNAAVEAARAGEQGRGFAVVASEVRSLAQRSAQAAKEIKALIDNSVAKVDAGSKLVDQAGVTMQEVVESIRRVTDIMGEISAASQEQTAGIEQVQQAVTQMDETTQQNAALVEEAAAAAESLREQAGKLTQVVSVFKLEGMQAVAAAAESVAPAKPKLPAAPLTKNPAAVASRTPAKPSQVKRLANAGTGDDWEEF